MTLDPRKVHSTTIDQHWGGQTTRRALGNPFIQVDGAWVSDLTGWEVRVIRVPTLADFAKEPT